MWRGRILKGVIATPACGRDRWFRAALAGALALAVAATAGLLLLRPVAGVHGSTTVAAPAAAGIDVGAISALLSQHGAALRQRDRAAFSAGLDTSAAAAGFRMRQLAMFDNTASVPFQRFSWRYDRPVIGAPVDAARARFGPSAVIVRVELEYSLRGIDAGAAVHPVWFTVVNRDGGLRLASDTDVASQGGVSWRGPWDFGPVQIARGTSCLVLGHPGGPNLSALAAAVDTAIPAVTAVWGTQWAQRVAVFVPDSQAEMDALAGPGFPLSTVAAVAVAEPTDSISAGPDISTGQRIVVAAQTVSQLSSQGMQVLLRHELTHVATRGVTTPTMATWVVEGFADYVANLGNPQPVRQIAQELVAGIAADGLPAALPTSAQFTSSTGISVDTGAGVTVPTPVPSPTVTSAQPPTGLLGLIPTQPTQGRPTTGQPVPAPVRSQPAPVTPAPQRTQAAQAYEQAWLAVQLVAELAGPGGPVSFYRADASASSTTADPAAALDAALRQVTGLGTAAFTARWQQLLRTELS